MPSLILEGPDSWRQPLRSSSAIHVKGTRAEQAFSAGGAGFLGLRQKGPELAGFSP